MKRAGMPARAQVAGLPMSPGGRGKRVSSRITPRHSGVTGFESFMAISCGLTTIMMGTWKHDAGKAWTTGAGTGRRHGGHRLRALVAPARHAGDRDRPAGTGRRDFARQRRRAGAQLAHAVQPPPAVVAVAGSAARAQPGLSLRPAGDAGPMALGPVVPVPCARAGLPR